MDKPPMIQQPTMMQRYQPLNPFTEGVQDDVYSLANGKVVLRYPDKLDAEIIKEIEEWFALIVRKMRRLSQEKTEVV